MDSIKDILSQLKKTIPKEKKKKGEKEIQSKLFDLDTLETNNDFERRLFTARKAMSAMKAPAPPPTAAATKIM